ncbi:MAG: hypothetical protein H5T85_07850 [Actinobacteria bacterium]|nr:hypothetical protein [Actinomycetota bacterium]
MPEILERLSRYYDSTGQELLIKLHNDCVMDSLSMAAKQVFDLNVKDGQEYETIFKTRLKKIGYNCQFTYHPLSEIKNARELARNYRMPDPFQPGDLERIKEKIKKYRNEYLIIGDITVTVFEGSWHLRGFSNFMVDLIENQDLANAIMDMVMEYHLEAGKKYVEYGVDMIYMGDDFGGQSGPLISLDMYRRFFKPRHAKIIEELKKINPDIIIAFHSCGSARFIIEDLIEIGVNILNPLQPRAKYMDPYELKSTFGDRLCFWGGIDEQQILPFGSPEDVRREVREKISIFGKGGGYILAPAHALQSDTPLDNVLAMLDEAINFGKYPLKSRLV